MSQAAVGTRRRAIESWLRTQVASGRAGDPLPSESELAARFEVSRMTARQAVQSLEAEGLVQRRRGAGTFVAPQALHRHSGPLMSFTEDMRRRGMAASSRLLTAEMRECGPGEAGALHLAVGQRLVAIQRLRLADGTPLAIESVSLVPALAGVLAADLEAGSLHEALRRMGHSPTTALVRISARIATSAESTLLDVPRRAAILQETRTVSDQHGTPIEFTTTAYVADRYDIDTVLAFTE